MLVKPVGDKELVNNQWQYKYMSDDLVVDIPLPWDIEIPSNIRNFKVDFGISINTDQAFLIVPKETLGNLRISYSPHLIIPGISRLIISLDNSTIYPTKIYAGQHYISMVSLNNQRILWKYSVE
jgi:hypothetical protein